MPSGVPVKRLPAQPTISTRVIWIGVGCVFVKMIVSGASEVQVKAIADAVDERLRGLGHKPWHVEGLDGRRWVLMDYVELVVHVFHERTRDYYLLERLWGDAHRVDLGLDRTD